MLRCAANVLVAGLFFLGFLHSFSVIPGRAIDGEYQQGLSSFSSWKASLMGKHPVCFAFDVGFCFQTVILFLKPAICLCMQLASFPNAYTSVLRQCCSLESEVSGEMLNEKSHCLAAIAVI